jgi:hypothetical protein
MNDKWRMDNPPEEYKQYFVFTDTNDMGVEDWCWSKSKGWHWEGCNVIAWMELPNPPYPDNSTLALNKLDDIITEQIDISNNPVECQTLRWVLDKISELI